MQRVPLNKQDTDAKSVPGVIDTVGLAYALLNHRPYLIWLPLLLDLYLWLGVRVSGRQMSETILSSSIVNDSESGAAWTSLATLLDRLNLFGLLAVIAPSLVTGMAEESVAGASTYWVDSLTWWGVPLFALLMLLFGILIGMVYLTIVSNLVLGQPVLASDLVRDSRRHSLNMLGFVGVLVGLSLLLIVPLMLFFIVLLAIGINLVGVIAILFFVAATWAVLILFFTPHAIVVSGTGPLRSIYLSYQVFRRNVWSAVGYIFVYFLILSGLPVIFEIFTNSPWSIPFALVAHAYIATGLIAAGLIFYRDRAIHVLDPAPRSHSIPNSST